MQFYPRKPQQLAIPFLVNNDRCNLYADMGMGKSVAAATALDILYSAGEDRPTLIMAPLRVAKLAWPSDLDKWNHLRHLEYAAIVGTVEQREAAIAKIANGNTQIALVNYEQLPWLVERYGKKWPFNSYIADESTRLKSFRLKGHGSKRAAAIATVAHREGSRWVNMTGTPTPNGMADLWGQCYFIDKGKRLARSYSAFQERWFRLIPGNQFHQTELMPHSAEEIQELISDVSMVLRASDFFDLPPIIHNTVEIELPAKARKLYDKMEEEFFIELDGKSIDAVSAGSKSIKLRQIAAGAVYNEGGGWSLVHDEKIDALKSVISEACGMPVLVAYFFKTDLERLKKAFPQGEELGKKSETIDRWNAGKIPILFISPASSSHGVSLQWGSNILCFFSVDFNSEYHEQVIERIGPMRQLQAGLNRKVFVHYILAKDTVDRHVFDIVTGKTTLQEAFKQALLDFRAKKVL